VTAGFDFGLELYWYLVWGTGRYWQMLDNIYIGGYFFVVTLNMITIRQQSAASTW